MMISDENSKGRRLGILGDMRWNPDTGTWIALLSYLLVVGGLYMAFQVFTIERTAANFITFGPVTLALFGIAIPVFYTALVQKCPLEDLGITAKRLIPSVVLGLVLAWDTYLSLIHI